MSQLNAVGSRVASLFSRPSLNRTTLIGTVGNDPRVFQVGESGRKTVFALATTSSYKNKEGNWIKNTEWHTISTYHEQAGQYITKNVKKGCQVFVEGAISSHSFVDKQGASRKYYEIVIHKGVVKVIMPPRQEMDDMQHFPTDEQTVNTDDAQPSAVEEPEEVPQESVPEVTETTSRSHPKFEAQKSKIIRYSKQNRTEKQDEQFPE